MKNNFFGVTFCLLIFTAGFVAAFSFGPPDGASGAPGEFSCAGSAPCHSSFPLNTGDGVITITGPSIYDANGGTAIINISIAKTGQSRWGFEATMLDANDNAVGFFMNDDPNRTQISSNGTREYIKHVLSGTDLGVPDVSPGWNIHWVSNGNFGPVTLYVAGNAANSNGNGEGDYIYTSSFTINAPPCCIANRGNADNDPNDKVDISDLVFIVNFIFTNGATPFCNEEANVNGDQAEEVDISDLVYLVNFIFTNGPSPPACP